MLYCFYEEAVELIRTRLKAVFALLVCNPANSCLYKLYSQILQ